MTFEPLTTEILVYYPVQYGVQSPATFVSVLIITSLANCKPIS